MFSHLRMTRMPGPDGKIWAIHGVPDRQTKIVASELIITDPLAWLTEAEWWQLVTDYNAQVTDPRDQLMRRGA